MSLCQKSSSAFSCATRSKTSVSDKTEHKRSKNPRVNWHEAASCALQIELRNYSDFLEYITEYILGKNSYQIDMLVIKKLTNQVIPKNIARIFKTFNPFEIKGLGSSVSIDSYYKTIWLLKISLREYIISIKRHLIHKLSSQINFHQKNIFISTVWRISYRIPDLLTALLLITSSIRNRIFISDICTS